MRQNHARFYDLNTFLRKHFGERVQKISVDAGMTCPNRDGLLGTGGCIYCNPRGSGTGASGIGKSVTEQILEGKRNMGRRYKARKFMAYFQSYTNTYAPLERLKEIWDEALAVDGVVGLAIGTRPDCINGEILDLLESYVKKGVLVWVEYGLQSVHDTTLGFIGRGHDFACFERAVSLTRGRGIHICVHVILGLPGEGPEAMVKTAEVLARMGLDGVKIHLLYVVRGTPLEELYSRGRYVCMEEDAYVAAVCDFLERLPPKMVIQRLTGDPHEEELVAPLWAMEKERVRNRILQLLEMRGTVQGSRFHGEQ
ncbi:TIGR01212 family radical SAM protein [Desulfobotulus sp. H1]|uniref:TIGR01212 family radical SAM protein n=1 Tax=Desulfobotulus pelophilus TaxID=2823377 RepID=A0ABT3NB92_9BACT|nr:TIGR01212 family radical SAM protein [Desulfobotulus pelophilus]MCW7754728.1 TIGR01212 family radical SAM protein [Desulfobotulus pelophilus]